MVPVRAWYPRGMLVNRRPNRWSPIAVVAVFGLLGCSPPTQTDRYGLEVEVEADLDAEAGVEPGVEVEAVTPLSGERISAVVLNGGGKPQINYYSHLDHVRRLLRLLAATGVDPGRIAVFSGDGADPAGDLATREGYLPPDFWLLPRAVSTQLRPPIEYVNSEIEGFTLRKASRGALREWFSDVGSELPAGDTLLFYVTDHGEKNDKDLADNKITLWGEKLSVSELQELLALLDPGVRVVMLMSQCYSGSFANAIYLGGPEGELQGNICGYFSATAERKAHGCYAEANRREAPGHSHRIFDALANGGGLPDAQREVLVTDDTPDVPHATTSFFLDERLKRAAERGGHDPAELIDQFLAEAWADPLRWEPEIRLLDRVGQAFGFASPRSLTELDQQSEGLAAFGKQIDNYEELWGSALETLRKQNVGAFKVAHAGWPARLQAKVLAAMDSNERRRELDELLDDLLRFTEQDRGLADRLRTLQRKLEASQAAAYRAEVRLAVVLRMHALLVEVAGRHYMERYASAAESAEFAQLAACEDLTLARLPDGADRIRSRGQEQFPTLAAERAMLEEIVPAWLGMSFRGPRKAELAKYELPGGASVVTGVFPDSPAAEARLEVGDIVLGPADADFRRPQAVREWVMQGEIDRPVGLRLLRDGEELELTIRLARYPLEVPKLPGPREIGSRAPLLDLEYPPGGPRLTQGRSHLLVFWATWCGPCKAAIPEVLAFARDRSVEVVAITDEGPETIKAFLDKYPNPFPSIVAMDPNREHFRSYGVSGTPTFVLVDAGGTVRQSLTGYGRGKGLQIEGWSWDGATK